MGLLVVGAVVDLKHEHHEDIWRQHDHKNPISNTAPTAKQAKHDRLFAANTAQTLWDFWHRCTNWGRHRGCQGRRSLGRSWGLRTGNLCGEHQNHQNHQIFSRFSPDFPPEIGCEAAEAAEAWTLWNCSCQRFTKVHKGSLGSLHAPRLSSHVPCVERLFGVPWTRPCPLCHPYPMLGLISSLWQCYNQF